MVFLLDWLQAFPASLQALFAGLFTWGMTSLGAALVLVTRRVNRKLLDGMLGFAAGVMIAASFWSLLAPAVEMAAAQGGSSWLPAVVGFLAGGIVIRIGDALLPHFHPLLPYALAFAAGAMIFVVIEELIPENQARDEHGDLATMCALGGFAVMMFLDVALG